MTEGSQTGIAGAAAAAAVIVAVGDTAIDRQGVVAAFSGAVSVQSHLTMAWILPKRQTRSESHPVAKGLAGPLLFDSPIPIHRQHPEMIEGSPFQCCRCHSEANSGEAADAAVAAGTAGEVVVAVHLPKVRQHWLIHQMQESFAPISRESVEAQRFFRFQNGRSSRSKEMRMSSWRKSMTH